MGPRSPAPGRRGAQAADLAHADQERREDDHGAPFLRDAGSEVEPRQAGGRHERGGEPLHERGRQFAGGEQKQGGDPEIGAPSRRERRQGDAQGGQDPDASQVERRRVAQDEPADLPAQTGPVGDIGLQRAPARAHQEVADVGVAVPAGEAVGGLAGALYAAQRDAHLRFARRRRQLFDGLAVLVAAGEVHAGVGACGIAPQDLIDQADAFEELAPIEGGAEAQARDGVPHRHLARGLPLVLAPDDVLRRQARAAELCAQLVAETRLPRTELAQAFQQPHHGRHR